MPPTRIEDFHAVATTSAVQYGHQLTPEPSERNASLVAESINQATIAAVQQARDQLEKNVKGAMFTVHGVAIGPTIGDGFAVVVCVITYSMGRIVA